MYFPKVITAPTIEPVSVADLKDHLGIIDYTQDTLVAAFGRAARQHVEWRTGLTLMQTTWEITYDAFPCDSYARLYLPRAYPLISVGFVKYTSSDGVEATWDPANYIVNKASNPGHILPVYGKIWPTYVHLPSGSVRVQYDAGLSTTADPLVLPEDGLISAIKLLAGGLYENRESEITEARLVQIESKYGVEALLAQYQIEYAF